MKNTYLSELALLVLVAAQIAGAFPATGGFNGGINGLGGGSSLSNLFQQPQPLSFGRSYNFNTEQKNGAFNNQQQAQDLNGSQQKFSKNLNGLLRNSQQPEQPQQQQSRASTQWSGNTKSQTSSSNFNNKAVNMNVDLMNQAPTQQSFNQQNFDNRRKNLPKQQRVQVPTNPVENTGRDQLNYNNNNNFNAQQHRQPNNQRPRNRIQDSNSDELNDPQVEEIEEIDEYELRRRMSKKRPNQNGRPGGQNRNRLNQNEFPDNQRFNNNNNQVVESESPQETAPRRNNFQSQSRIPSRTFDPKTHDLEEKVVSEKYVKTITVSTPSTTTSTTTPTTTTTTTTTTTSTSTTTTTTTTTSTTTSTTTTPSTTTTTTSTTTAEPTINEKLVNVYKSKLRGGLTPESRSRLTNLNAKLKPTKIFNTRNKFDEETPMARKTSWPQHNKRMRGGSIHHGSGSRVNHHGSHRRVNHQQAELDSPIQRKSPENRLRLDPVREESNFAEGRDKLSTLARRKESIRKLKAQNKNDEDSSVTGSNHRRQPNMFKGVMGHYMNRKNRPNNGN